MPDGKSGFLFYCALWRFVGFYGANGHAGGHHALPYAVVSERVVCSHKFTF